MLIREYQAQLLLLCKYIKEIGWQKGKLSLNVIAKKRYRQVRFQFIFKIDVLLLSLF